MNRFPGNLLMVDDSKQDFVIELGMALQRRNYIIYQDQEESLSNFAVINSDWESSQANKRSSEGRNLELKEAEEVISIQIGDIAARRAKDDEVAKNKQTNKQKHLLFVVAQIKAVMEDNPAMMQQSIEYLTSLAERAQLSIQEKKVLNKEQIIQFFSKVSYWVEKSFYNCAIDLLSNQLQEIIQEFIKQRLNYPASMKIQIQILAHFLKILHQFQQYLPKQISQASLNLTAIIRLLNLSKQQYNQLNQIYLQHSHQIAYLELSFRIRPLAHAYYFIVNKQRTFSQKGSLRLLNDEIDKAVKQLKQYKAQAMKKSINFEITKKYSLSEFYANRQAAKKGKLEIQQMQQLEPITIMQIYEEILHDKSIEKEDKRQICKKYGKKIVYQKFKRYYVRKSQLLKQYNNGLSDLKDAAIIKQLIRNPNCEYEDVAKKNWFVMGLFIGRDYFEENVHRLLEKEANYQQLRYLEKIFKWADQYKARKNVHFIDCCNLNAGNSAMVVVTLAGTLTIRDSLGGLHFLKEAHQFLRASQRSIVFLFVDQATYSKKLEEQRELFWLSKLHILFLLPRVSLAPNPCKVIASRIGETIRERMNDQGSWKSAFEAAIHEFDEANVKNIVQKEWEKTQRLAYPEGGPRRLQEQRNNDQENSYIVIEAEAEDNEDDQEEEEVKAENERGREPSDKLFFPRGHQKGESLSSPNPQAQAVMENLQACSIDDLRLALARLLQLNKNSLPKRL